MQFFLKKAGASAGVISIISIFFIITFLLLSMVSCRYKTIERIEETREMMGTYVSIIVYSDRETGNRAINAAFERIEEIEDIASIYDPESEASFLNENGYIENPSSEFLELINTSIDYYTLTGGCFDITVQPLLDLWSGGLWEESEEVQEQRIAETLEVTGSDKISVGDKKIEFSVEGMAVTLGGIAKGYAVDEAIKKIKESGINSCLVNAGGDIYAMGVKPGEEKWVVELESPDAGEDDNNSDNKLLSVFSVVDRAVTTSGGYHRYYDTEKKVHHIMDPRTGYSAAGCRSVTIISDSCTGADILATSIFVMGPEDGLELIESLDNVEAFIMDSEGKVHESSGLLEYIE